MSKGHLGAKSKFLTKQGKGNPADFMEPRESKNQQLLNGLSIVL